ncbi:MAG: YbhB/YbcL family Raf kinase inhibitor-like protein [Nanoarchaeota archaeon]|nr:YbhB/YbcL family Raf kinase inhibitor-like protein [Nanoarchaeota archaeon]
MNKLIYFIIGFIVIILVIAGVFIFNKQNKGTGQGIIVVEKMELKSIFEDNKNIPSKYTCDGEDVNPYLEIGDIPKDAKSLVLIVDDPDAPVETWVHWVVWNIQPGTNIIEENSVPEGATQGLNDFRKHDYGGPCPPTGEHRYFFKIYALDSTLNLDSNSEKSDIERAMYNHVLAQAELVGLYSKG